MKLVCIGDCGIDRYQPSMTDHFGGITFNFAHHAIQQFSSEWDINVITAVGEDENGERVIEKLEEKGLNLSVSQLPGKTPIQEIKVQADGEKKFVHYDPGVLQDYRMKQREAESIATADLMVTTHFQQIEGLFHSVMKCPGQGLRVVDFADFSDHPSLLLLEQFRDDFDIGFFGMKVEQKSLIRGLQDISRIQEKLLVVTLGAAGCIAFNAGSETSMAAIPVSRVVDTTGAGDSFAAGFLGLYYKERDIPKALARGAESAARTVAHLGATPA
jgi:sugar/nucleoside kinase (ribokinase family)